MNPKSDQPEQVAWIDQDEKLIKPIPLTLANSDPKYLHQEIAGLVYDDHHQLLLQQRALTKRVFPGIWTVTVAGHVTYGDSLVDTFHKELGEEMGIKVENPIYLFREDVRQATEHHYCHWYLGKYQGESVIVQPEEVAAYAWVSQSAYPRFANENRINERTNIMLDRFWSGEWDKMLL
jgi:isopentenyl-diphosphate delta-isomerase